ncbi:MAG: hypothetical protein IJ800_03170 [Clostridia bacterium]|nr:hypothetical protein [Clostridia bacterium]
MYNYRNGLAVDEEKITTVNRSGQENAERDTSLNLDMILNYENYRKPASAVNNDVAIEKEYESVATEEYASEDLTPSSTTMQFTSVKDDEIYEEIRNGKKSEVEKKYKINTKGKMLIAVYAIAVVTILALIFLNARMLRNLDGSIEKYNDTVTQLNEQTVRLSDRLEYVSSDEVVVEKAESFGMVSE